MTKSPIKVMGLGVFSGSLSYPEAGQAMQAAAKGINAAGGIDGHPLELTLCDDQDDPNVSQSCARQAVSNHDVAVVTGFEDNPTSVIPVLQSAGIPFIGDIVDAPDETTSKISFPLDGGVYVLAPSAGIAAVQAGCKKLAILIGSYGAGTTEIEAGVNKGLTAAGGTNVANVVVSSTATDYSPYVQAAIQKGAQCIDGEMRPANIVSMLQAMQQSGSSAFLVTPGASLPPLSDVKGISNGTVVPSVGRVPADGSPAVSQATAEIHKYYPSAQISAIGLGAWAAVQIFKDAAVKVHSSYTPQSVLAAMGTLSNASSGGIFPPYTTTKPGAIPGAPRIYNTSFLTYKINNDTISQTGGYTNVAKP